MYVSPTPMPVSPVARRTRGLSRSFQRTSIFPGLTVREQLALVDARHQLYQKLPPRRDLGTEPLREPARAEAPAPPPPPPGGRPSAPPPSRLDPQELVHEVERVLLDRYAPPGVLINAAGDVLQVHGETAPFPFFADFGDAGLVDAVRRGRQAEFAAAGLPGAGTPDPCDPATFAASKLDWSRAASAEGQAMLALVRQLLAWKRSGVLGPRDRAAVQVQADAATRTLTLRAPRSLTVLNLSDAAQRLPATAAGWRLGLATLPLSDTARLPAFGAAVFVTD